MYFQCDVLQPKRRVYSFNLKCAWAQFHYAKISAFNMNWIIRFQYDLGSALSNHCKWFFNSVKYRYIDNLDKISWSMPNSVEHTQKKTYLTELLEWKNCRNIVWTFHFMKSQSHWISSKFPWFYTLRTMEHCNANRKSIAHNSKLKCAIRNQWSVTPMKFQLEKKHWARMT